MIFQREHRNLWTKLNIEWRLKCLQNYEISKSSNSNPGVNVQLTSVINMQKLALK